MVLVIALSIYLYHDISSISYLQFLKVIHLSLNIDGAKLELYLSSILYSQPIFCSCLVSMRVRLSTMITVTLIVDNDINCCTAKSSQYDEVMKILL